MYKHLSRRGTDTVKGKGLLGVPFMVADVLFMVQRLTWGRLDMCCLGI